MGFSITGALNKIGDGGEKLLNKGKKVVGSAIEHGAHIVGDGLDKVGLDGAADWVEDKGDAIADHLGAHVGEQQLGQSEEPDELLHGDPDKVRGVVAHLAKFSLAFESGHQGLSHLDPGDWDGLGADAFRTMFKAQPEKWAHAATACAEAGLALEHYSETLTWARGQAKEAVRLWKQGVAKSKTASATYNKSVDTYHDAVKAYNDKVDDGKDPGDKPVSPGKFVDPGAADRQAARDTLSAARKQRNSAAADALPKVQEATKLAPTKPQFTDRMKNDFGDVGRALPIAGEHFVGGVVRSVTDLEKFARGLNPYDPYNMTHPAQYVTHLNSTAAGLLDTAAHPERLPGMILGTGWGSDGSEAGGRLLGNILIAIATDGGSAAGKTAGESAAEGATRNAAKDAAESAARNGARGAAEDPVKAAIERAAKKCVSDPIDVATGDMILAQTDITLPGTLPLVLERTHLSSYRVGRFFGPSWASTLDQRLELDDQGVVFVCADGSLLLYPVPRPGVAVLPAHGPRWPLEWDGRPGSPLRVTDIDTGRMLHFSAVPGTSGTAGGAMTLPLAEVSDRNGNAYAVAYDEHGVPTEVRHSGGYHLTLDSEDGRITALRLKDPADPSQPGTAVRDFGYDTAGNLTEAADFTGLPYRYTYDDAARMTSWTDRNDSTYRYAYDARGRCVATHGPDGFLSSTLAYDDATRTTSFTDSLGRQRTYVHDAAYRLVAETDPLGHTTTQEWDGEHQLVAFTGPLGHTTRYAYDDAGRLASVVRPDGSTAAATYDALGMPLRVTEPGGATWTHAYDDSGNLLSTTDPAGAVTCFVRDVGGQLVGVTDPLGHTRRFEVNAAGLPVTATDPLGHTARTERDVFGRPVVVTDPLGNSVRLGWTPEGRPAWREDADGGRESWVWDGEGNLLAHTDQVGQTTGYSYTHFDLAATRTDPDGRVHSFGYDTELRLTEVTNPQGSSWTYAHDAAGRVVAETDFNGRTLTYTRDPAGQVAARTDGAGRTTTYTRDALGRLTRARAVTGEVTSYAHDRAGHLKATANADASVTFERDALGRVLAETVNGRTTGYTYDAAGHRLSRTTPSGHTSTWTYDPAGRPVGLDSLAGSLAFGYDLAGRETERRIGDALSLTQTWDRAGRLTGTTATHGAHAQADRLLHHRTYTYRPDNHLAEERDLFDGTRRYDLDPTGRVTAVHTPTGTEAYAYDDAGNLTRDQADTREFTGTLLHRTGRTTYTHDAQGRLTRTTTRLLNGQKRVRTYTWNTHDRLTSTQSAGTTWTYTYDPLGRRTAKQQLASDGSVLARTDFTWDGLQLAEQTTPDGHTTTWDYTPDSYHPLTQTTHTGTDDTDARFYAIVTDLVGTPTHLLTPDGDTAWHTRTHLWGPTTPTAETPDGTPTCPLRFPGQYADDETGLHYNHHRYYDPTTARYLTPDPLGLEPADNDYAYVPNPTRQTDPLGLAGCDEWKNDFDNLPKGRQDHVREMPDEQTMRDAFDRWTAGAERLPARGPKIPDVYRLEDGTVIQWRTASASGGATIDIQPANGGKPLKVHLP